uniref:universal stress protein n=1 Tax=Ningiella ruwaisensis TaxID=2364274 RepID=UPI0010A06187|nr:universal stress protein [Ningiella ruwaisensis]
MRHFKHALFVLDKHLPKTSAALKTAIEYAQKHSTALSFICVLPDLAPLHYSNSSETLHSIKQTLLDATRKRALEQLTCLGAEIDGRAIELDVLFGKEYIEVSKAVLKKQHDLVIKQVSDPSWLDSVLGSNDLHLLRKCPCAIWLIDAKHNAPFSNVVAAIDFSDDDTESALNINIASHAASFCDSDSTQMHVLSVCDGSLSDFASLWANDPNKFEREYLEEEERRRSFSASFLVKQLSKRDDLQGFRPNKVRQHILKGHAETLIPETLKTLNADLLVMGTIARGGVSGMLIGNTAEAILLQLPCSVLALKPTNFITPIATTD